MAATCQGMARPINGKLVRRHVVACAFPFGSHAAPLLLLVRQLAAASPDVCFTFLSTDKSNGSLFKGGVAPLPNIVPRAVHDGVPEGHVFSGHPGEPIGLFLRGGPENFRRSMAEAEEETGVKISCVVSDGFLWFCASIAEEKGANWVPLWTSGAASLSAHFHTDLLRAKIGNQGQGLDEPVGIIPGFATVGIRDLPDGVVSGDLSSPFSQMLHNMARMLPKAAAIAVNSFDELDPEITEDLKANLPNFLNVGPFPLICPPQTTKADEYGCIPFLEGRAHASVAYISFGTVATPSPQELVALAEALEDNGIPFIWSLNEKTKAHLPEGFVERTEGRGKVVPWAPQVALLAHPAVGVFVTHGGWNSVMESVIAGVPMICKPFLGDQFLNRRFIQGVWRIGTGLEADVFTKTGTLDALERVLGTDEGKRMRERITELKHLAEAAVGADGGSSIKNLESLIRVVTD